MSDFIKVNFRNGGNAVHPKKELHLESLTPGIYYASTLTNAMLLLACCAQVEMAEDKVDMWMENSHRWEITREEYYRLCKELGVDDSLCRHVNKNYSQLATTACAARYRIVFWECEDCGYLEAEQPTREELGVE